jgi:hypothetical protein
MKGTVEFRNPLTGRYGVRTEHGHYTTFQLLSTGVVLDPGEEVADELDETGVHTMRAAKHGPLNVFVEMTRRTRAQAEAWVQHA